MDALTKADIYKQLESIFRTVFGDDSIKLRPEMTANDIAGWDSLNQIKIIISCEKAFGVRLKPRELNAVENVDEMVDHLMTAILRAKR